MLLATTGLEAADPDPVLDAEALMAAQALVRCCRRRQSGRGHSRPRPQTAPAGARRHSLGTGSARGAGPAYGRPRACAGRAAPLLADVAALAPAALRHRLALGYAARAEGQSVEGLIGQAIDAVIRDGC